MFYKKCNTCTNRTCEKTGEICESMDAWLKKYGKSADILNGGLAEYVK